MKNYCSSNRKLRVNTFRNKKIPITKKTKRGTIFFILFPPSLMQRFIESFEIFSVIFLLLRVTMGKVPCISFSLIFIPCFFKNFISYFFVYCNIFDEIFQKILYTRKHWSTNITRTLSMLDFVFKK